MSRDKSCLADTIFRIAISIAVFGNVILAAGKRAGVYAYCGHSDPIDNLIQQPKH